MEKMIEKTSKLEDTSVYVFEDELKNGVWVHYKGHNIPKDILLKQIHEDWDAYIDWGYDSEDVIEILDTEEEYYYCSRFMNGEEAKDNGCKCWI
jgi:hypothetical protein